MKKLLIYISLILMPFMAFSWTSSNNGESYTMDDLVTLSDSISFNDSLRIYEIRCNIIILENDSLFLDRYNKLHFIPILYGPWIFYGMKIYGYLEAIGAKTDYITINSPNNTGVDDPWTGIHFKNSSSILKYCELWRGVNNDIVFPEKCILCNNSSPIIDHCKILHMNCDNESYFAVGIYCHGESYPIISNSEFLYLYNSCAIYCGNSYCEQDITNYPSPLIFNCNIGGLVTWNLCLFPETATVINGGFLDNCYLYRVNGVYIDTTLGTPIDTIGDGICNTISTANYQRFYMVDGVTNPRSTPVNIGVQNPELDVLPTTTSYLTLKTNHPNPFRQKTTIPFTVNKKTMEISLSVFNTKGKMVKVFFHDKPFPPGKHNIEWDGTGDTGKQLPPGIYFYKLTTNGMLTTKQAVIIQ